MSNVMVELVRYDTEKTTKRKRKDFLVNAKTEDSVIDKLEKIHKGDTVKTIHELIWAEDTIIQTEEASAESEEE